MAKPLRRNRPVGRDGWLDTQLEQAKSWQWQSLERIQFLLRYQLDPALAEHPAWAPVENETADVHFTRSSKELFTASAQA